MIGRLLSVEQRARRAHCARAGSPHRKPGYCPGTALGGAYCPQPFMSGLRTHPPSGGVSSAESSSHLDAFAAVTGVQRLVYLDVEPAKQTPFGGAIARGCYARSL